MTFFLSTYLAGSFILLKLYVSRVNSLKTIYFSYNPNTPHHGTKTY